MATELSGILDHVDRISELDLEGVEPTSHVVALENVLRPDEPRPSLPRERALEPAPTPPRAPSASRLPGPRERRAARAHRERRRSSRIAAGELSSDEYFDAYARRPPATS